MPWPAPLTRASGEIAHDSDNEGDADAADAAALAEAAKRPDRATCNREVRCPSFVLWIVFLFSLTTWTTLFFFRAPVHLFTHKFSFHTKWMALLRVTASRHVPVAPRRHTVPSYKYR